MTPINVCPDCGSSIRKKEGVSKKTGQPYSFTGCSNFPECKWILKEPYKKNASSTPAPTSDIMDALRKIYGKLEKIESDIKFLTNG